jgi:hypothetical protein
MEMNIDAAKDALMHPTDEILETMRGASEEAQAAIASIAPANSALASLNGSNHNRSEEGAGSTSIQESNGHSQEYAAAPNANQTSDTAAGVNGTLKEDTARLQVVDEVSLLSLELNDNPADELPQDQQFT